VGPVLLPDLEDVGAGKSAAHERRPDAPQVLSAQDELPALMLAVKAVAVLELDRRAEVLSAA